MKKLLPVYIVILSLVIIVASAGSRTVTVMTENRPLQPRNTVVLDAGHGGIDGGATSVTGVLESKLNLEITQRLEDLLHLLGIQTVMIRQDDSSVCTEGNSIAEKKLSDLKNRVKTVNKTENPLLISIHQNYFTDSRYSGAQVFYADTEGSKALAESLQKALVTSLNPGSKRLSKPSKGVYLMQHIDCTGVLIECGFISNYQEESRLRSAEYQKRLSCVIATTISLYFERNTAS